MKRMLLFDIDGTLLMTGGAGRFAFNQTFKELFDKEGAYEGIRPDGKTDPLIMQEVAVKALGRELNAAEIHEASARYVRHFLASIDDSPRFRLLPGVMELMRHLSCDNQIICGLATGNFSETSWAKIKRARLEERFCFGGFGEDAPDRTGIIESAIHRGRNFLKDPDFPAARVTVIGDTPLDIEAGRNAGTRTVGVATGRWTKEDLEKYKPDAVLQSFEDKDAFLSTIL
jgi:phosphoglycolate phosphatase